jgi:hypothetical protein
MVGVPEACPYPGSIAATGEKRGRPEIRRMGFEDVWLLLSHPKTDLVEL